MSSKVKSCLLCENYNTHPCKCEHCEDWDNFHISESGKALREKIYGDGYQDGHKDGYDKGYDDAQSPKSEWIKEDNGKTTDLYRCSICGRSIMLCKNADLTNYPFCHCGADMRGGRK